MITKPTVLILGAGASQPYGFPSGYDLKWRLHSTSEQPWHDVAKVVLAMGHTPARFLEFSSALRDSGRLSIDAFLEHRPDLLEIGRAAIAASLVPFERPDDLADRSHREAWYELLLEQLDAPRDRWGENQLTVVTYNYDRSLEYFLMKAIASNFRFHDSDALRLLTESVPIIHLHGRLSDLSALGRPYEPSTDIEQLTRAARGIKIIGEANPDGDEFTRARDAISAAERVAFLGFGYHETNLDRLGHRTFRSVPHIGGTAFGLEKGRIDEINSWFNKSRAVALEVARHPSFTIRQFLARERPLRTLPR